MSNQPSASIASITASLLKILQSRGWKVLDHSLQTKDISSGYNFCSEIVRFKVHLKRSDDDTVSEKSFVFKIPSTCPFYDQLKAMNFCRNEVLMYSHVLPAISRMAECSWIATCYLIPDSDNLVFEDLNAEGYKLMDKRSQLDLAHSKVALKALAELHALSVKLHEVSPETVEMITIPPREPAGDTPDDPGDVLRRFEKTAAMLNLSEGVLLQIREFVHGDTNKTFYDILVPNEKLNVLCHGDFWLGNMLFRHNDRQQVEQVKMLDFQVAHWGSPVPDLMNFFVTSMPFDVYKCNRDDLIELYLETFNGLLESLGSKVRYCRLDLDGDMSRYKKYHLYCLGRYLSAVLNDKNPFNNSSPGEEDQCYTNPLYQQSLRKWLQHLNEENLL